MATTRTARDEAEPVNGRRNNYYRLPVLHYLHASLSSSRTSVRGSFYQGHSEVQNLSVLDAGENNDARCTPVPRPPCP